MEKQNQEKTLGKTQQKLMPKNGVNIDYWLLTKQLNLVIVGN